jgi:hypothetical protein
VKSILTALFFIFSTLSIFPDPSLAAAQDPGLVEVHYPIEVLSPYKERRRTHGANVGVNLIQMIPYNWESLLTPGEFYSDVYGETPISLASVELGYKFNFVLGSLSFLLGYGSGFASTEVGGVYQDISVTKYLGKVMYIMDNLFSEPYVAPYVAGSAWQMTFNETQDGDDEEYFLTTGIGYEYSAGLLIQLNWIEDWLLGGESTTALADMGLENTYIDLFVSQHLRAGGEEEAPTATDYNYGAGLRLEF